MQLVSILITVLLCLSFFILKREQKLIVLIVGNICFDIFQITSLSFFSFRCFSCICFFISEFKYFPHYYKLLKRTPIIKLFVVVTIGALIVILYSPHINNINTLIGFLTNDLFAKYFVIAYSFVALKDQKGFVKIYKFLYPSLLFITFIGVINLIIGIAFWKNWFSPSDTVLYANSTRFRVLSTFLYSFDYGQVNFMLLLLFIYGRSKGLVTKSKYLISLGCCLFGILGCGSRTVLASSLIGIFVYVAAGHSFTRTMKYYFGAFICLFLSVIFIPQVREKAEFLLSAIDSDSNVSGSSSEMRIQQYTTVFMLIQDSPVVGKGHNYFLRDIGWDKGGNANRLKYKELAGLEGAIMSILLERGYIGVIVYLWFYFGLIIYAIKLRRNAKAEVAVVIALLVSFIAYGNMTGELHSALLTLLFSGVFMKIAYSRQIGMVNKPYMFKLVGIN